MPKLKAVLFDLDGTIRDTREVIYPSIEHALKVHTGKTPTRAEMEPYIHHHSEIHKAFAPDVDFKAFHSVYYAEIEVQRYKTSVYADATELIAQLYEQGYSLGMVSAATTAKKYLEDLGVLQYFGVVIGEHDTTEHKPHPAPVFAALKQLRVDACDAVMVGDLPADILAASSAKVRATIGVTHGFGTRESLETSGADYIIDSLAELPAVLQSIEKLR